jgi:hypothetical protein
MLWWKLVIYKILGTHKLAEKLSASQEWPMQRYVCSFIYVSAQHPCLQLDVQTATPTIVYKTVRRHISAWQTSPSYLRNANLCVGFTFRWGKCEVRTWILAQVSIRSSVFWDGTYLPTFRDNLSVPPSRGKESPLDPVANYESTLGNIPEEQESCLLRGGSLNLRKYQMFTDGKIIKLIIIIIIIIIIIK